MDFLKKQKELDINKIICHSGGALGSDTIFEEIGNEYGIKTKAYSYNTNYHKSENKFEISNTDYLEGIENIKIANKKLKRFGINKFINLLSRNWCQVKYSDEIFAIGYIIKPNEKGRKGYYNKSNYEVVDGGTGYAIQMGIDNEKEIYVFDQKINNWFKWSYITSKFIKINYLPKIESENFAGIGTREITEDGIKAISELYKNTFK